jgi:hypothetical protein
MKALMAAIALLCVSSTVLAHDIYSTLRDRDGSGPVLLSKPKTRCFFAPMNSW